MFSVTSALTFLALLGLGVASAAAHGHTGHHPALPPSDHLRVPGGIADRDQVAFYVRAEGGGVERLDPKSGARAWHAAAAMEPIALVRDLVIAIEGAGDATSGTRLLGLSVADGTVKWTTPALEMMGRSYATNGETDLRVDGARAIVHVHGMQRSDFRGRTIDPRSRTYSVFYALDPATGACTPDPGLEARWMELAITKRPQAHPAVPDLTDEREERAFAILSGDAWVLLFDGPSDGRLGTETRWLKTDRDGRVVAGPVTVVDRPPDGATSFGKGISPSTDLRHLRLTVTTSGAREVRLHDTATGRRMLVSVDLSSLRGAFLARGKQVWMLAMPKEYRPVSGQPYTVRTARLESTDLTLKPIWSRKLYGYLEFEQFPFEDQ